MNRIGIEVRLDAKRGTLMVRTRELELVHDPDAMHAVDAFYEAIESGEFEVAWQHIEPCYREDRWENDLKFFKDGYDTFLGSRRRHAFVVEATPTSAKIDVFYEEDQFLPDIQPLADSRG